MSNTPARHKEKRISALHNAISLTPDILKVLEETREGAMEELQIAGDYEHNEKYLKGIDEAIMFLQANRDNELFGDDFKKLIEDIKSSKNLNSKNGLGTNILHFAAAFDCPELIRTLIKAGMDVNGHNDIGRTPLMLAVERDNLKAAIELMDTPGVNILKTCPGNENAIDMAMYRSNEISRNILFLKMRMKLLDQKFYELCEAKGYSTARDYIEHEKNIDVRYNSGDLNLLQIACKNGNEEDIEIVKACIQRYADLNGKSRLGRTPLMYAVEGNNLEIVKLLMKAGADPNITVINDGVKKGEFDAADLAKHRLHMDIAEYLLGHPKYEKSKFRNFKNELKRIFK